MYDLMFNVKAPMEFIEQHSESDEWNEGVNTFGALKNTVAQCLEKGHFNGHSLEPLSFMIWGLVHGMCCLEIRHRTRGVNFSNPETILTEGYNEFLKVIDKL